MKKLLLAFLFLFLVQGFTSASSSMTGADLIDVNLRFCNDQSIVGWTKSLSMEVTPGENNEICFYLFNKHTEELAVKLNFVDGTITNDAARNKACKNEDQIDIFWKYVVLSWNDTHIYNIPAESAIQEYANFTLPGGYAGKLYACATLILMEKTDLATGAMFTVVNRLWYPIEILVSGDIMLDFNLINYWSDIPEFLANHQIINNANSLLISKLNDEYFVNFSLVNSGNVLQDLDYSLVLNSWSNKMVEFTGKRSVVPGESIDISIPISVLWYDMPLDISLNLEHQALFDFESDLITEEMKSIRIINEIYSMNIISMIMYYIFAWILFVFLLLTWLLILKKRKKKKNKSKKRLRTKRRKTKNNLKSKSKAVKSTVKTKRTQKNNVKLKKTPTKKTVKKSKK